MIVAEECRHPASIERAFLTTVNSLEKGQAFLKRCILQINCFCDERVTDGWRLREQGRDPRARFLGHCFSCACGGLDCLSALESNFSFSRHQGGVEVLYLLKERGCYCSYMNV